MLQPETLKPNEQILPRRDAEELAAGSLSPDAAEELYHYRQSRLEGIRPLISLKLYHSISEKLDREHATLGRFLNWESVKQDALAQYSFILDTQYFEQKFFSH